MSNYYPDSWVVVKVKETGLYKVLAGWSGDYLEGDSWRINSGIQFVEDDEINWLFHGASGSCYVCSKTGYAMRMSMVGIYTKIKDKVELLDEDTDWMSVDYET